MPSLYQGTGFHIVPSRLGRRVFPNGPFLPRFHLGRKSPSHSKLDSTVFSLPSATRIFTRYGLIFSNGYSILISTSFHDPLRIRHEHVLPGLPRSLHLLQSRWTSTPPRSPHKDVMLTKSLFLSYL